MRGYVVAHARVASWLTSLQLSTTVFPMKFPSILIEMTLTCVSDLRLMEVLCALSLLDMWQK